MTRLLARATVISLSNLSYNLSLEWSIHEIKQEFDFTSLGSFKGLYYHGTSQNIMNRTIMQIVKH